MRTSARPWPPSASSPPSLAAPKEAADAYLHATLMGETGLEDACSSAEPLDELDDAFARIEYKLVAQSA